MNILTRITDGEFRCIECANVAPVVYDVLLDVDDDFHWKRGTHMCVECLQKRFLEEVNEAMNGRHPVTLHVDIGSY